jgi:HNH endonuclease
MTQGPQFLIKWQNKDAKGSIDLIDGNWLAARTKLLGRKHPTLVGRKILTSTFDIIPEEGGTLLFRYGGHNAPANQKEGIYLGDMRILPAHFANATEIAWRVEGVKGDEPFEMLPVRVELVGATEGKPRTRSSTYLSRNSNLAVLKRAHAKANGKMKCEACSFEGLPAYGEAADRCFEVHHKRPLAKGKRVTNLDGLALICANCHNAVHGLGDISFEEFLGRFE